MALKALAQRWAKPAAKTLSELLAQVFTASKEFSGTFSPEGFQVDYDAIVYNPIGDIDDEGSDLHFSKPFQGNEVEYCCGLLEIGSFRAAHFSKDPAVNSALMRVFMAALNEQYNMVMATTITSQKIPAEYLTEAGFVEVAQYKSKNTGSTITVWMKDFTSGPKELPEGDLDLTSFDWND